MLLRRAVLASAFVLVALFLVPAGALGAVEIGSRCSANDAGIGSRVQTVDAPGGPSYAAPSAGVITQWGTVLPAVPVFQVKLKIVRPGAAAGTWSVIRQSEEGSVTSGTNIFATRLPVAVGDRIAIYSATGAVRCVGPGIDAAEQTALESSGPDTPDGGTITVGADSNSRIAMFAVIEPDADGDGFGDETQDLCPLKAAFQVACPTLKLSKYVIPGTSSFGLLATSNVAAPVTLSGSARVPAHDGKRAAKIRFKSVTKTVTPGIITKFKLRNPSKLKSALRRLPRSAKVKLTLKLTGTAIANTDTQTIRATFRGRR